MMVLVLVLPKSVTADFYTYECDALPTSAGWTLIQSVCEAEEWNDNGQLIQSVSECEDFPGFGAQIDYTQDVDGLSSTTAWFIEWKMTTTGISDEIPFVAPAALVVFPGNAAGYHFTIADDQMRLIVGFQRTHYVDLVPGMHTYRLEVFGENLDELYVAYVDGNIITSGDPDVPLFNPPHQAGVNIRAKSELVPSTTTWDYLRWGDIAEDGSGDLDGGGQVDDQDVPFFLECFENESGNWIGCAWADFDGDGDVDCDDAAQFQAAWTAAGDPPVFESCTKATCPDLNDEDLVNAADLAILLGGWGVNPDHAADLNHDGSVNAADLALLLGAWGPCNR